MAFVFNYNSFLFIRAEGLPRTKMASRDVHWPDRVFHLSLKILVWALVLLLAGMVVFIGHLAWPALEKNGAGFFLSASWHPGFDEFGSLSFIFGTIVSSLLAILLAAPLSIAAALFLVELAPRPVATVIGFLVEMLAAIPSVVYGLWGIFVLAPLMRNAIEPWLANNFGFLPLFSGTPFGVGMLTAGVILAIMITPTICAVSREIFQIVPRSTKEAALGLGATRWEMIRMSVLRSSWSGVLGAIILGLGRAMGETMAVTMVIGNRAAISASLFSPGQTMASVIANEYAEASSQMHQSALAAVGLTLFAVSLIINGCARGIVWQMERRSGVSKK